MTDEPIQRALQAISWLSDVLRAENAALRAVDIPAANNLLADKTAATEALAAALRGKPALPASAREAVARLMELSRENKSLLERAMAAQKRVIAVIARVVPRALGNARPYTPSGRTPPPRNMPAIRLQASI
jgi:hypothetical protein